MPATPNKSLIDTWTPAPASTACTWFFRFERSVTSLARCRTSSDSSRVAGGAIHVFGRRLIRSRSARSAASHSSFLTLVGERRDPQRVCQVHRRDELGQGVRGPAPAGGADPVDARAVTAKRFDETDGDVLATIDHKPRETPLVAPIVRARSKPA